MLESHLANHGAISDAGNVLSGKRQECVHDETMRRADADEASRVLAKIKTCQLHDHLQALRWDLGGPQSEPIGIKSIQLRADGSNMVDQAQLLGSVPLR